MWMMDYNDAGDLNMPDSFTARKLRPAVVPRPLTTAFAGGVTGAPPCLGHVHGAEIFALNHHLANNATDQSKREQSIQQVVVSSRWNPTPEQLRVLEGLYRRGTRTPSPEQIQNITAQLRRYGKIEGKNVFYWFQNHKARERQKRRRQMELSPSKEQNNGELQTPEIRKESSSGASRTLIIEEEQTENRPTTMNCSTIFQKSEKASTVAECTTREAGWLQVNETELGLPYRKNYIESSRNATRHMMQVSCLPPLREPTTHTLHVNTPPNKTIDQSFIKTRSPSLLPYQSQHGTSSNNHHLINVGGLNSNNHVFLNEGCAYYYDGDDKIIDNDNGNDSQTLQLFPLRSSDGQGNGSERMHAEDKEMEMSFPAFDYDNLISSSDNVIPAHHHFFEFLPLKN